MKISQSFNFINPVSIPLGKISLKLTNGLIIIITTISLSILNIIAEYYIYKSIDNEKIKKFFYFTFLISAFICFKLLIDLIPLLSYLKPTIESYLSLLISMKSVSILNQMIQAALTTKIQKCCLFFKENEKKQNFFCNSMISITVFTSLRLFPLPKESAFFKHVQFFKSHIRLNHLFSLLMLDALQFLLGTKEFREITQLSKNSINDSKNEDNDLLHFEKIHFKKRQ